MDCLAVTIKDIGKHTRTLPREEIYELARRWRQDGDIEARNALIESGMKWAIRDIMRYQRLGIRTDDLISLAMEAVVDASKGYDPDFGCAFTTYCSYHVRNVIAEYRKYRYPLALPKNSCKAKGEKLKWGLQAERAVMRTRSIYTETGKPKHIISKKAIEPIVGLIETEQKTRFKLAFARLTKKERYVLKAMSHKISWSDISKQLGVPYSDVRTTVRTARQKMQSWTSLHEPKNC